MPVRAGEGAVLRRIGGELVKREPDVLDRGRVEKEVGAHELGTARGAERLQLRARKIGERCALPVLADQDVLGLCQSLKSAAERLHEIIKALALPRGLQRQDRKSTRLNSSHLVISYAVFCLKKKTIM